MNRYNFSVSEVFPDGRVMVVTYVRIEGKITMVMDVYDDQSLSNGTRYVDVQMNTNALPKMGKYEVQP